MAYHEEVQLPLIWDQQRRVFTVTDLTEEIRGALGSLADIWVAGEISGAKAATSGHFYFTLKDNNSQIRCACFARAARFLRFKPRDGVEVVVRGRLDVYAARGDYQLLVESIEPRGYGALQIAFEELKKKLASEGLFDAARKRPLPAYPRRIGLVTSPTGAVIQDMLNILTRRFPGLHIRLFPALVQGEGSVEQVVRGINFFSRYTWADVLIVARGGGSVEDLWTFNEEAVARAIANCSVPVIAAIGHETDFTIADFVADLRAPTPSAAAELVIGTRAQLAERCDTLERRLLQTMRYRMALARRRLHDLGIARAESTLHRMIGKRMQRVDELEGRAGGALRRSLATRRRNLNALQARLAKLDLRLRLAEGRRRLEAASAKLEERMRRLLAVSQRKLETKDAKLQQLSPLRVLERGYAIVQRPAGAVVKSVEEAPPGSELTVRLAKGRLRVQVESTSE